MADVLLTVSGTIAPDTANRVSTGEMPRRDYAELADALPADLVDYGRMRAKASWLERLIERLVGPNAALAWYCFCRRGRYRVLFTDGEQVGIPLALMLKFLGRRRARHVMIVHILSVGKKLPFFDRWHIQSHIDLFIVYSSWQQRFIQERWQIPAERIMLTPFQADEHFFRPEMATVADTADDSPPLICAVGLERRDYPTLMRAARELPHVQVVIAAGSPWSKWGNSAAGERPPDNVTVQHLGWIDLRDLYARSRFVVVPLENVEFQAGVTTILEAMAMAKAVIVTRTPGQTDVVIEGETGLYVPPGDAQTLSRTIQHLLDHPDEAAQMGANGRRLLEKRMSLSCYIERLRRAVEQVSQHA